LALDEDVESSRVGVCETPLNGPSWAGMMGWAGVCEVSLALDEDVESSEYLAHVAGTVAAKAHSYGTLVPHRNLRRS
jgi:hypothetical protein